MRAVAGRSYPTRAEQFQAQRRLVRLARVHRAIAGRVVVWRDGGGRLARRHLDAAGALGVRAAQPLARTAYTI